MTDHPPTSEPRADAPADGEPTGRPLPYRLGHYTLFDRIGQGGMADIYLARARTDLGAARLVVIKEVRPELLRDQRFTDQLVAEAKLASRLNHPNVVSVEELGRAEGALYIVMEYVEGLDLRELLRQCSRRKIALPASYALHVVCDVLRALDHAHRLRDDEGHTLGLVHRDVSPSNVLLSFDGEVKLCDFGIAGAQSGDGAGATIEGKAGYMSPEHARGEPIDARADLFAAGVLLWELLMGRRMYRAGPDEALIDVARRAEVPGLAPRGLPNELEVRAIVERALAVDPAERYASAGSFVADLESYCMDARAVVSPMRFGQWLSENFAEEKVDRRRARERVLAALENGPAVVLEEIVSAPPRSSAPSSPASAEHDASALEPGSSAKRPKRRSTPPPSSKRSRNSKPPPSSKRPSASGALSSSKLGVSSSLRISSSSSGASLRVSGVNRPEAPVPVPLGAVVLNGAVAFAVTFALLWALTMVLGG